MIAPFKENYDNSRQCIKKQRHHFADKSPYSQSYGFSRSHIWMWKLDQKAVHQSIDAFELCFGEYYWESLGLKEEQTSQS